MIERSAGSWLAPARPASLTHFDPFDRLGFLPSESQLLESQTAPLLRGRPEP